ncbi:MAG: hypothetical protein Q7J60_12460 [Bradyrhizobium sp.]|nr:hypothetical protein [Bradyrhizobium sp.]
MTSTGTLWRIVGAAILLIAVQFASVAAKAHAGHGHGPDAHHQSHGHHAHGTAAGNAHATSSAAVADRTVQAEATAHDTTGAPSADTGACVMGCCGYTGCCGAALAAVSPSLPPKACPLRVGFARLVSVHGVDPQGLRKPPRFLA